MCCEYVYLTASREQDERVILVLAVVVHSGSVNHVEVRLSVPFTDNRDVSEVESQPEVSLGQVDDAVRVVVSLARGALGNIPYGGELAHCAVPANSQSTHMIIIRISQQLCMMNILCTFYAHITHIPVPCTLQITCILNARGQQQPFPPPSPFSTSKSNTRQIVTSTHSIVSSPSTRWPPH